ncbi:MAG: aminodeoxychorismate synthase component I [Gemmatimonadaceae bacterium]
MAGVLAAAERHSLEGRWVVGVVNYEAAPAFDSALAVQGGSQFPLAWFAVFDRPIALAGSEGGVPPRPLPGWTPDTPERAHAAAVERIHRAIGAGDYLQANLTFRLHTRLPAESCSPWQLYRHLRRAQPESYAAFIEAAGWTVVSASPELFFERRGRHVVTRPMKGTARRGRWAAEDESRRLALAGSEKDHAENLMIVDLLRNDLGRVAELGSVRVPELCAIERHPTVWQMTSTVEADVRPGIGLPELFGALFPCGSVTGAPKVAAMRAICDLERSPRGVYCGAIGLLMPGGDATFAVAIRTAVARNDGAAVYGVGGGIVWDSRPDTEYAEALAKGRVLQHESQPFALIETVRLDEGRLVRHERHLRRLAASAAFFAFGDPIPVARCVLAEARAAHPRGRHRLRLLARQSGIVDWTVEPIAPLPSCGCFVRIARRRVDATDPLLFHKTTRREWIDAEHADNTDVFDVLFVNDCDEVTEFGFGNVVVEVGGERLTPPRECGLLAGVFREELLEQGEIREAVLHPADLLRAARVWLVNSLREWVPVCLI